MRKQLFSALVVLTVSAPAIAGEADVLKAEALHQGNGVWRFNVTVAHGDEGWKHYANRFDVVDMSGNVLGVRKLLHPHETEQPFTRSLGGVDIPDSAKRVVIRAHDSVHKLGGKELTVELIR